MPKKGRYAHLKGSSAYYPFGARTKLRRRQRRHVVLLRVVGLALLVPAAVVAVRQIVFRGGQPQRPDTVLADTAGTPENAGPVQGGCGSPIRIPRGIIRQNFHLIDGGQLFFG